MKTWHYISISLTLVMLVALVAKPAVAQSNSPEALDWFSQGVQEKDIQKKIAAYTKAIAADPDFVEALYNLGVAYRQSQDYVNAERVLQQALNIRPDDVKNDLKTKILFELAVASKKQSKPDRAEANLLQAKALAGDDKIRALVAAELARLFYEQSRYVPAINELHECLRLDPSNQAKYTGLIASMESTLELQRLYERATQAKLRGNPTEARALFEQIRSKSPQFKDVQAQLTALETRQEQLASRPAEPAIEKETETGKDAARLFETAKRFEAEGNTEKAIAAYEELVAESEFYEEARDRLQGLKQRIEQERAQKQLEEQYASGMVALRQQDWTSAVALFKKVVAVDPGFRDGRQRLTEAEGEMTAGSMEAIVARHYDEGVAAMNRNDLKAAQAAFEKARSLNPNYREVAGWLSEIEGALERSQATETPAPAPVASVALAPSPDSLYQVAMALMANEDWGQAALVLEKLQIVQPNYRDAVDHLARARVHLSMEPMTEPAAQIETGHPPDAYLYVGALALVLVLAAIFSSPTARARIHLWRGNRAAAEAIYEKLLARNPQRMSLYPQLAELCLSESRQDEFAMKVYKKALQSGLPDRKRKVIRSFVMQNYLEDENKNGESGPDTN